MNFNFKKIASVLSSAVMMTSTIALAAAANFPAPYVQGGTADVAVVYGSNAATTDLIAAVDIQSALADELARQTASTGGVAAAVVTGEAYPLFTGSSPLLLNASLSAIRSTVSTSNLPGVLADKDFSGNVDAEVSFKIDIGTNPRVTFGKEPTSSDDPSVGVKLATTSGSYLYNATITFNKDVNFSNADSEGEEIELFGQSFTIASATDASDIVLFRTSETIFLSSDVNPSQEVTVNGDVFIVELAAASDTSATIRVTNSAGDIDQKEINEAASKKILGLEVGVNLADEATALDRISAEIIVGAEKVKLTDGSEILLGTDEDPIDGTQVSFVDTIYTGNISKLIIQVFAPSGSEDFISPGASFVDPLFGTFKIDFAGLSVPLDSTARETISIDVSGNDLMTVSFSNWQGKDLVTQDWYNNQTTAGAFLADSEEWQIIVREGGKINESAYTVVGNEEDGYLLRLRTLTNISGTDSTKDKVIFENVFDTTEDFGDESPDTEGTAEISINDDYTVYYLDDRDGDDDEHVRLDFPDSTGQNVILFPTIETSAGGLFAFYEPVSIDLNDWLGRGNAATALMFPDGNGFTTVDLDTWIVDDHTLWNVTFGTTTTTINTTIGGSASGSIGKLTYNVTFVAGQGLNTTVVNLVDVNGGNINNPAIVLFEEEDDDNNYEALIVRVGGAGTSDNGVGVSDVDFTWNTDADMVDGSAYGASGFQRESNDDLYDMMDFWGTLVTTDRSTSDQYTTVISYPSDQVTAQVYVAEVAAAITAGQAVSGAVVSLGNVLVTDSEAGAVSNKNLVVVGGSCINSVAADLLGGGFCSADFESNTGVGAGSFLIETFARSGGKVATLVAGYNAGDTTNAATYLATQTVDTMAGVKYTGTSATSASLVTGTTTE